MHYFHHFHSIHTMQSTRCTIGCLFGCLFGWWHADTKLSGLWFTACSTVGSVGRQGSGPYKHLSVILWDSILQGAGASHRFSRLHLRLSSHRIHSNSSQKKWRNEKDTATSISRTLYSTVRDTHSLTIVSPHYSLLWDSLWMFACLLILSCLLIGTLMWVLYATNPPTTPSPTPPTRPSAGI